MRTISSARAAALRGSRRRLTGRADAARAVRAIVPGIDAARVTRVRRGQRAAAFCADVEELMFEHEIDVCLPCTAIWPRFEGGAGEPMKSPAVVIFDDQGRWTPLRRHGWGAAVTGYVDRRAKNPPIVLSADLRGWGDTAVAPGPYDLAGWSGLDRWTSYHAAALNDGLLGQRTRDAVAIIRWLLEQQGVDANRLIIAGAGVGGIVALLAAAMFERVAGVVCDATPVSIEAIVAEPMYRWTTDVFHPGILLHVDLPELRDALSPVLCVRACNADESSASKREQSRGEDAMIIEWIAKRLNGDRLA